MSLLQDASFILVPSAYKAGKVYAENPTNGNGDLTWTRNSTANRTQSNGLIGSVAIDVPRLSYMYGSCPALLLEPQRTNLIQRSQEFDNATWVGLNATITANTTISPDGTQNADRIQITNASSNYIDNGSAASLTNGATYTISCFVKSFGGTNQTFRIYGNGNKLSSNFTATSNWQRFEYTFTATSTVQSCGISSTSTPDIAVYGYQLEAGAYPTTYIATTTASATRIADAFTRNNIYTNGLISASGGTWFVELRGNLSLTRDNSGQIFIGNSTDIFTSTHLIAIGNFDLLNKRIIFFYKNGGSFQQAYATTTDTVKIAIKWNGSTADVFANGTKVVSAFTFSITNLNNLIANGAINPTFIQQMALYPTPLSDTDCTTLTTL